MTGLELRPATEDQVPTWRRFREALFGELSDEVDAFDIERLLNHPDEQCVIAYAGGTAVGFAEMALRNLVDGCTSSPVAYLEAIYVDPGHRGGGIGRALMDFVEAWARDRGCTELASDTGLDDVAAQRFHRGMGFDETFRIVQFRKALEGGAKTPS